MLYQSQKSIINFIKDNSSVCGKTLCSTLCCAFLVLFFRRIRRRRRKPYRLRRRRFSGYLSKVVDISRVKKAGRSDIVRFRALIAVGNKSGIVGLGIGKNRDTRVAILSGRFDAKKNFVIIPVTGSKTISHLVRGKYGAAKLMIKPASLGAGLTAGGSTRSVLQAVGIKNAVSKRFGSNSAVNNAKATILALLKTKKIRKLSIPKRLFRIRLTINGYHIRLVENLLKFEVWDPRSKHFRVEHKKKLNLIFNREPKVGSISSTGKVKRSSISSSNRRVRRSSSNRRVRRRSIPLIFTHNLLKRVGLKPINKRVFYCTGKKYFKTELYLYSTDRENLLGLVKHFLHKFCKFMIKR